MSNELKAHTHIDYSLHDLVNMKFYLAADVDALLAKKDAAIAELKQKLEDVQASVYAESVDAGMRERRLSRALYKACANWAIWRACVLEYFCIKINAKKWERMYHKCLKMAEEFK